MSLPRLIRISALTLAFLIPTSVRAETYIWTGGNLAWYNVSNTLTVGAGGWNLNGNPDQPNTWAGTNTLVLQLNANSYNLTWNPAASVTTFTVNQIVANLNSGNNVLVQGIGSGNPVFNFAGTNASLAVNAGARIRFTSNFNITDPTTFNVGSGGVLFLNPAGLGNATAHTISGGAGSSLTVTGGGTVVWRNATVENISVNNGLLTTDANGNFLGSANVSVGASGIIDTATAQDTFRSLTGTGIFRGFASVNQNDGGTFTFGGQITDRPALNITVPLNQGQTAQLTTTAGAGSLTKAGNSTMILTGTNTYTGGTTISAGSLQIGDGGTTGSIGGNVTNNANLTFNRSDDITFGGTISGTGSVTQAGSGTLILSATNSYSGVTNLNNGFLSASSITNSGSNSSIGSGNTINFNGGGLIFTGSSGSTNRSVVLNSAGSVDVTGSGSALTFSGVVSGGDSLIKDGAGTLILSNSNNSYTGSTIINSGILSTASVSDTGVNSGLGAGVDIAFGNAALQYTGATASTNRDITIGTSAAINVTSTSTALSLTGTISGGALTKNGPGTLVLTGDNSYSGGTTVNGGALVVNNTTGSATGTGAVNLNNGSTLAGTGTINGPVNLNAGSTLSVGNSVGTLTVNNNVSFTGGSGSNWLVEFTSDDIGSADLLSIIGSNLDFIVSSGNSINIDLQFTGTSLPGFQNVNLRIAEASGGNITINGGTFAFDPSLFTFTSNLGFHLDPTLNATAGGLIVTFAVPEPTSVLLISTVGLGVCYGWRRRKANTAPLAI